MSSCRHTLQQKSLVVHVLYISRESCRDLQDKIILGTLSTFSQRETQPGAPSVLWGDEKRNTLNTVYRYCQGYVLWEKKLPSGSTNVNMYTEQHTTVTIGKETSVYTWSDEWRLHRQAQDIGPHGSTNTVTLVYTLRGYL